MTNNYGRLLGRVGASIVFGEALLIILSWLLSAMSMAGVRSLLSGEGIRWLFGGFTDVVAHPLLIWLILLLMALGSLQCCGILNRQGSYRERIALRVALMFAALWLVVIALLTLVPHALLLSASGHLFPSAFSRSLVPVTAFGVATFSIIFGLMSGRLRTLSDIIRLLAYGIQRGASLIVLCLLVIHFCASLHFVFG